MKNPYKPGDWVTLTKDMGGEHGWSEGDMSKVVYVSGEFVDVEDCFGGKRGCKDRNGVQRVHCKNLEYFRDVSE